MTLSTIATNDGYVPIEEQAKKIDANFTVLKSAISDLPMYASNTAAKAGGLVDGDFYAITQTSGATASSVSVVYTP